MFEKIEIIGTGRICGFKHSKKGFESWWVSVVYTAYDKIQWYPAGN